MNRDPNWIATLLVPLAATVFPSAEHQRGREGIQRGKSVDLDT